MIYVFILAAVVVIPYQLGGWSHIFALRRTSTPPKWRPAKSRRRA